MSRRHLAVYAALAAIWGFSFLLLVRVIAGFGWAGTVSLRALLASGLLLAIAKASGRQLDFSVGWRRFAAVGATTVAGQLVGMTYATPVIGTAMAAILVGAIPLMSMLIGKVWGHEHMDGLGVVGLVLGLAGVVMLVGFPAAPITLGFLAGCLASVLGSLSAAFGSNYALRNLSGVGSWEQTIGAFFFGGVFTLPLLLVVPVPGVPTWQDWAWLLALAGTVSSLAYVLYFRLVAEVGATRAISVEFVVTVIAVAAGALVLGEKLTFAQFLGGAVILAGAAMVVGLWPRRQPAAG